MFNYKNLCNLLPIIILTGCRFSAGVKKDLYTGLTFQYYDCTVNDVQLKDNAGIPLTSNLVHLNSQVEIAATGVGNFQLVNGRAYPGCELTVQDSTGKIIAQAPNVLADASREGIVTNNLLDLSATVSFSEPLVKGQTYEITARFFDTKKQKREVVTKVDLWLN